MEVHMPIDPASVVIAIATVGGGALLLIGSLYLAFAFCRAFIRRLAVSVDGNASPMYETPGDLDWTGTRTGGRGIVREHQWGSDDGDFFQDNASSVGHSARRR